MQGEHASKTEQNGDIEVEVRFLECAVLVLVGSTLSCSRSSSRVSVLVSDGEIIVLAEMALFNLWW